jgi:NAD-dependent deacetylase
MQTKPAAELLQSARYAVALTGAGISTPSGIPDFRSGMNGLWNKHNPLKVASLSVFRTQPENFFSWFRPLAGKMIAADPNPAHLALAALETSGILKSIITQNVDGLHQRAGAKKVFEVHGTMSTLSCTSCFRQFLSETFIPAFIESGAIPHCENCGSILKPDVILFQEQLPQDVWREVELEIDKADLLIVVGSSLEVIPVSRLPYRVIENGGRLIIINHQPTYIDSRADVTISEDVATALPAILEAITHV